MIVTVRETVDKRIWVSNDLSDEVAKAVAVEFAKAPKEAGLVQSAKLVSREVIEADRRYVECGP